MTTAKVNMSAKLIAQVMAIAALALSVQPASAQTMYRVVRMALTGSTPIAINSEGKILLWQKKEGESVKRGDILAEVETDKANLQIESFQQGVLLKIIVPAQQSAKVGDVIAVVGAAGESVAAAANGSTAASGSAPAAAPKAAAPAAAPAPVAAQQPVSAPASSGRVKASTVER